CEVDYRVGHKWLERIGITLKGDGVGRIYWNEQNDVWQPFYGLLGATLTVEWQYVKLQLWGRNLTDTKYDVFYFRSMGNDFLQHGKPRELGATIVLDI
ncbi:MAG: TonB-dependent receptor, partial [Paludibacteraceae bacterium]|nr:TonB-dependent receptor [Paludibacteraceae bacterium]